MTLLVWLFSSSSNLDQYSSPINFISMNLEQTAELIAYRRSIKPIDMDPDREITKELWDILFECANWAPNHGHTEPWRFSVYAGDARKQMAEALQHAYKTDTPSGEFRPEKHEKMGLNPLYSNAIVAIIMKRGDNPKIPAIEEIEAVACAVQNLHLAAASTGLGVFWSSPSVSYGLTFGESLGLAEDEQCLGVLYVGWPKEGKEWPKSSRKPAAAKVTFK